MRRADLRLPVLQEAKSRLQDYFDTFNLVFPLFHQASFMHQVEQRYTRDRQEDSG
jgi:hypothetical protein